MLLQASQCINKLGLQDEFDIADICVPLLLLNNINLIQNHVYQNQQQQQQLVLFFDHLLHEDTDADAILELVKPRKFPPVQIHFTSFILFL